MLTSWLWIHSPDRHRGVDVVCSNRSLGLESTSSVVNERLLIPQVHQHKKGKTTLTAAGNSSGEVQKIDHAPTRLFVDRSTSSTFPPDPFLAFRHHSVDNWTLLKSTSFVRSSGARASCLETERSPLGWRRKLQGTSDIDHGEWRRVAKKSVGRSKCVRCVCVMTRCQVAQGNQNKMAKLPRTPLSWGRPEFPGWNVVVYSNKNWEKKKVVWTFSSMFGNLFCLRFFLSLYLCKWLPINVRKKTRFSASCEHRQWGLNKK